MKTIEILAGDGIEQAFKDLDIVFERTYFKVYDMEPLEYSLGVYELSEEDFKYKLDVVSDDDWKDEWGWWRQSEGSNMGPIDDTLTINKHKIYAWYEGNGFRKYNSLIEYFNDHLNISSESNICHLSMDLAKRNNLTLGQLFSRFN